MTIYYNATFNCNIIVRYMKTQFVFRGVINRRWRCTMAILISPKHHQTWYILSHIKNIKTSLKKHLKSSTDIWCRCNFLRAKINNIDMNLIYTLFVNKSFQIMKSLRQFNWWRKRKKCIRYTNKIVSVSDHKYRSPEEFLLIDEITVMHENVLHSGLCRLRHVS